MVVELIKLLDVIKGLEVCFIEGGIGGMVQVNICKLNEFKENFLLVFVEGQFNDLIDDLSNKFNVIGVYKFNDDLGVLVNVIKLIKNIMIYVLRNMEWVRFVDYDNLLEKIYNDVVFVDIIDQVDCVNLFD